MPERMSRDRADLDALFESTVLAHLAFVDEDGSPAVVPTVVARLGDTVVAHGSTGSRWMRLIASGIPTAVSLAAVDGVVVARSAFESSLVYTSGVLFGSWAALEGEAKEQALRAITDRLIPGRTAEVRASTKRELAATMVLGMPIGEWSLRSSDHWPEDPDEDVAGDAWAGVLRYGPSAATVHPAPDLRLGIPEPASIGRVRGVR